MDGKDGIIVAKNVGINKKAEIHDTRSCSAKNQIFAYYNDDVKISQVLHYITRSVLSQIKLTKKYNMVFDIDEDEDLEGFDNDDDDDCLDDDEDDDNLNLDEE